MDLATPRAATARIPWRTIGVLALVILLLAALVAVYAGSQRRVPAPFGPAANGLIPIARDGDILVGDPVSGTIDVVVGGPENDFGATFSPDGTHVAFLRASADCPIPGDVCPGGEYLVVADGNGANTRVITDAPLVELSVAAWLATSDALVVNHLVDGMRRLEVLPIGGGMPRVLAEDLTVDRLEVRPPNGSEILVRAEVDGAWGLFTLPVAGGTPRLLAPSLVGGDDPDQDLNFATYSPDGALIYYNRYTPEAETIQAWVMSADGSNQRRFNAAGPSCCWWEGEMAPSPDGRWVVLWRSSPTGTGELVRYPADGSGPGVVIGPYIPGTALWHWAPDSTRLLVNPNDQADGGQVMVDPDTGTWETAPWTDNSEPDWQRLAP
jgi:hypothetical protein